MFRLIRIRGPSTSFPISSGKTKTVLDEVNDAIPHSKIQWRSGRSNAAPVPSRMEKPQSAPRKRVSRAQRRAMVESYVSEYRETHAGKFPTVSGALKHVGGSYYILRKILQELEHNSKSCSSNGRKENILGEEFINERELLTKVEQLSTRGVTVDAGIQHDSQPAAIVDVEVDDTSNCYLEVVEELQTSETVSPKEEGDCKGVSHPCPRISEGGTLRGTQNDDFNLLERKISEDYQKTHTTVEDLLENDKPKHKEGTQELDRYSRLSNDVELQKRSIFWENLKSLADAIVNIWRK